MNQHIRWIASWVVGLLWLIAVTDEVVAASSYKALTCPEASADSTWTILDRNGANQQVTPYLSSLGGGEGGTGVITSPPFIFTGERITFTLCGHDGQAGGQDKNFIALVDARKGNILVKTPPPQSDAMQEREWDARGFRNVEVRIEVHDGNSGAGFAWLGVGQIDAGPAMRIDFREGMPEGWARSKREASVRFEDVAGGVPFRRNANAYTIIPASGSVEIPCGFAADRLLFLGCTASGAKPLETYGGIEIHYREGSPDVVPLLAGFTLDGTHKRLSPSAALHLHPSGDPYQSYLAIKPRSAVIEKIRLVAQPKTGPIPRITAITCETSAESERLTPLPAAALDAEEAAWIESHTVASDAIALGPIMEAIRRAHKLPTANAQSRIRFRKHTIDAAFRSEGVAVADFNGDGRLDIAAGNVFYTGPDWKPVPMLGEAKAFNRYGYSDAFLCYADDVNRDGAMDLIAVGFPGKQTYWLANPGAAGGIWRKHLAVERTGNESPAYADIDGDGRRELIFMDEGRCLAAQPTDDPTQPWRTRAISNAGDPAPGHGLGIADVNGDGRVDVLIPDGWWQGQSEMPWPFHAATFFGGAQLCVADLDGDGDNDVLGSSAHGYGIAWSEQTSDGWKQHEIDDTISQTHAIALVDFNGDGLLDFVTGKRFWAHNGHDVGSFQPAFLCWYEQQRQDGQLSWVQRIIDTDSGVGLHFEIVDLNGDGLLDIVTSNKKGVYYFEQVPAAPV
ncbi:MAG: VCBS repeat-containing protein [Phycisphaerae bacterium]|nr:VCBS repeat-containing protein [Phycisphaerae bacterium]